VTGEWRRCCCYCQKNRCLAHKERGVHKFTIARGDDPGFPQDFDQRHQNIGLQRGFDRLEAAEALFIARANIPAREADRDALHDFVQEISQTTIELYRTSPRFQPSSIPRFSATRITRRMRLQGSEAFEAMLSDVAGRIHYVNLLTDAGTVHNFNALHAILINPHYSEDLIPFDTYENLNYTSNDYEEFYKAIITEIREHELEIVAIICDNCPAQVNGLWQSLAFFPELAICHIPCLNHMANLVFSHVLQHDAVAQRIVQLDQIIHDLRSPEGTAIVGRKCPKIVRTRWIYAVEVLYFVLRYEEDVNTVLTVFNREPVPESFRNLYRLLLPLRLFSESMEARERKLYEVIPVANETLHQFRQVRMELRDDEDLAIFESITAQFVARLKGNAFETMITAWTLSHHGRQCLRAEERDFLTRFNPEGGHLIPSLECVLNLQQAFRDRFTPWTLDMEQDGPIPGGEFNPDDLMPIGETASGSAAVPLSHHGTAASRYQALVAALLEEQALLTPVECVSQRLDAGAFQIACKQIQDQADSLSLPDARNIVSAFRAWLFARNVPDEPVNPDAHWRELHARGPAWTALARIGLRYASIATSEADVERVIGEQQQIQGPSGVNFGTETLHARLVLRHHHRV
jgi:hypothetical protein